MAQRRRASEVLSSAPFYPDLNRVDRSELLGIEIFVHEMKIHTDWDSREFGKSEFALLAFSQADLDLAEPLATTLVSGVVVMKKLKELKAKGIKSFLCTLTKGQTAAGNDLWGME